MDNKKKYKYIVIAILSAVVIFDLVLFYFAFLKDDSPKKKEYSNDDISFTYTSDYTLKEKGNKISLGRDDESGQIDIVINELSDDTIKRDVNIIINEANQEFEKNNKDYFMSYYGDYKTNNYTVHDFLYADEENGKQIDINYIIKDNKLILITYINKDQYFDLYEQNTLDLINSIKIS